MTVLLDVYGGMLTKKQRETMELYYEQDFSLAEISEETGITRQGAMNCLRASEERLRQLELELSLIRRSRQLESAINELEELIFRSEMRNEAVLSEIDEKIVEIKKLI